MILFMSSSGNATQLATICHCYTIFYNSLLSCISSFRFLCLVSTCSLNYTYLTNRTNIYNKFSLHSKQFRLTLKISISASNSSSVGTLVSVCCVCFGCRNDFSAVPTIPADSMLLFADEAL